MKSETTILLRGLGRSYADSDEIAYPADRVAWTDAPELLRERRFLVGDTTVQIEIDWRPVASEMLRQARYTAREYQKLSRRQKERTGRRLGAIRIPAVVTEAGRQRRHRTPALDLLRLAVHEAFLILNIAVPGSFSAAQMRIETERYPYPVSMRAELFEDAWISAIHQKWPSITPLPVSDVISWHRGLGLGTTQVATSRIAKALFSIQHASQIVREDPTVVIWLAQCLESLFGVPTALSRNILQTRSFALFGNPTNEKSVTKELREFYEARNSFAHGGAAVLHPLANEDLDGAVIEALVRWLQPAEFAASLVVAALQHHAQGGWQEIKWNETMVPIRLHTTAGA